MFRKQIDALELSAQRKSASITREKAVLSAELAQMREVLDAAEKKAAVLDAELSALRLEAKQSATAAAIWVCYLDSVSCLSKGSCDSSPGETESAVYGLAVASGSGEGIPRQKKHFHA